MENLPRDYWKLSSRNFIGIGILLITSIIYSYMGYARMMNQLGNPGKTLPLSEFAIPVVIAIIMFTIGVLFRKHNRFAVHLAYISMGLSLFLNVILNLNIFAVLVALYVLYFVYKAQKNPQV